MNFVISLFQSVKCDFSVDLFMFLTLLTSKFSYLHFLTMLLNVVIFTHEQWIFEFLTDRAAAYRMIGYLYVLSFVCSSVCGDVYCGCQGFCRELKVVPSCSSEATSYSLLQTVLL